MCTIADVVLHMRWWVIMAEVIFNDYSDQILKATKKQINALLEAWGMMGESFAKQETPVDTGRLRNSITHEVQSDFAVIGTNVEYAEPVEYNENAKHTVGNAHFMRNAVTQHNDEYKQKAEMILGELK